MTNLKEARAAHAERLAKMQAEGGKSIKDYYDPAEPFQPHEGRRIRRSRFMEMTANDLPYAGNSPPRAVKRS